MKISLFVNNKGRAIPSLFFILKIKNVNKLLIFRTLIIAFLITNFVVSFTLETVADCTIMFFTFLMAIGYIGAELIINQNKPKN